MPQKKRGSIVEFFKKLETPQSSEQKTQNTTASNSVENPSDDAPPKTKANKQKKTTRTFLVKYDQEKENLIIEKTTPFDVLFDSVYTTALNSNYATENTEHALLAFEINGKDNIKNFVTLLISTKKTITQPDLRKYYSTVILATADSIESIAPATTAHIPQHKNK